MNRKSCDWINFFCKKSCDWIKNLSSHSFWESIYKKRNRLGIDLGIDFSLIINKVTDGTDFFHLTHHPYFFSIFFFQRKVRNGEKPVKSIPKTLKLNASKHLRRNRFKNQSKTIDLKAWKLDLVRECRGTGLKFTNESLRNAARILHTLKFINHE